jgi:non-specific serine/threonine protein kinase/serine/threonine-protein kinase
MGDVWLAEQTAPIRRRVALKVIKPGMDSRQVVARFEAERQALALMNHSCVAKVYDAGTTPEGRPFFAMEYVPGAPITEYCARHHLGLRDRLLLFRRVCDGVQHAHHKAIIHRDLKPGNVLVMEEDGEHQPKIIDFGVAKATSQKLTEQTMFTQLGVIIGTPEYMSPEQAELTTEDVDTRADVYSLGVILYELLAGALPFEPTQLRKAGFDGIRRMIREEVPPRPSVRASTQLSESPDTIPEFLSPELVDRLVGDLDWITMRALEKDRTRRYDTPMDLSRDIERHLLNQPVTACPPTLAYRTGRFVRRNRLGVTFAAILALTLMGSGVALAVLYARSLTAERIASREAATAEEALTFLSGLFEASNPFQRADEPVTVRDVLDIGAQRLSQLDDQPAAQVKLMQTMASAYHELGDWETARSLLERAIEVQSGLTGPKDLEVGHLLLRLGHNRNVAEDYDRADAALREARELGEALSDPGLILVAESLHQLAFARVKQSLYDESVAYVQEALTVLEKSGAEYQDRRGNFVYILAWGLGGAGRIEEAKAAFEEALQLYREQSGPDSPAVGWALNMYGYMLTQQTEEPDIRRGIALLDEAYALNDRLFDGYHVELAYCRINASVGYHSLGDDVMAEAYAREAVGMASNFLDNLGHLGGMKRRWARYLAELGREKEAETVLRDLLDSLDRAPNADAQRRETREALAELGFEAGGR